MNILPKKSWHVRTKKNIERVRRDEEQAAEEEKEKQRRIALAEQEARTDILRDRSRKRGHHEIEGVSTSAITGAEGEGQGSSQTDGQLVKQSADISLNQGGHINFFRDIEHGLRREGKNKEHEAEKAAEKEKLEKKIGLLTYLGQSAIESQNEKPWYLQKSETEKKASPYDTKQSKRENLDKKLKDSMDPLKEMHRHLEKRHKKHPHHSKGKNKQDRQDSRQLASSSVSQSQSKATKSLQELRAERLKREAGEKQKIAAVMARARGENPAPPGAEDERVSDADRDRSRGYNSRYNPNFVKPVSHRRR